MNELPRVMSIEDDCDLFEIVKVALQPLPIELYHAQTGKEAIDLVSQVGIDVIILDLMLPDTNGWTVLKQISAAGNALKGVIVLTAHTNATHRVIAHLQEVTAYMKKPFKPDELRDKVSQVLDLVC